MLVINLVPAVRPIRELDEVDARRGIVRRILGDEIDPIVA